MRRREDTIFRQAVTDLRPAFAEATKQYVKQNRLTVDLPFRNGDTVYFENPYETQVCDLFEHAFLDFCRRNGGTTARTYERKAEALRKALAELDINDPACVLFYNWDLERVIKPALEAQADAYDRQAQEHGRYTKNISFERCIKDRFAGHPIPKPAPVHGLAIEIEKALRPVSPSLADKIKVSTKRERREVRRLLER